MYMQGAFTTYDNPITRWNAVINSPARKQAATALDHILRDVLLYQDDSPVVLALEEAGNGITNLIDIMSLRHQVVPTLTYQTEMTEGYLCVHSRTITYKLYDVTVRVNVD